MSSLLQRDSFPSDQISWADGCIIVYSLIDKESFDYAVSTLESLEKHRAVNNVPITLLGNKLDLEHLREVSISITLLGNKLGLDYLREVSISIILLGNKLDWEHSREVNISITF